MARQHWGSRGARLRRRHSGVAGGIGLHQGCRVQRCRCPWRRPDRQGGRGDENLVPETIGGKKNEKTIGSIVSEGIKTAEPRRLPRLSAGSCGRAGVCSYRRSFDLCLLKKCILWHRRTHLPKKRCNRITLICNDVHTEGIFYLKALFAFLVFLM